MNPYSDKVESIAATSPLEHTIHCLGDNSHLMAISTRLDALVACLSGSNNELDEPVPESVPTRTGLLDVGERYRNERQEICEALFYRLNHLEELIGTSGEKKQ